MNEVIKELSVLAGQLSAEECNSELDRSGVKLQFNDVYNRVFAELIVKECAKFADELSQFTGASAYGDGYESALKDMSDSILEHFGVDKR